MNYIFFNQLILRTPYYAYSQQKKASFEDILADSAFKNSLFLSNPTLYKILADKEFHADLITDKERLTLKRYYNRMIYRPTPFGSFSSFTLTEWGRHETITLSSKDSKLHLSLDQQALLSLSNKLFNTVDHNETFIANPAIYKSGRDYRFIKSSFSSNYRQIHFDLESIEKNALTSAVFDFLGKKKRRGSDIINFIIQLTECEIETAFDYVKFLIGAQLIIPTLAINIIGDDYFDRLVNQSNKLAANGAKEIQNDLKNFSFPDTSHLQQLTRQVNDLLQNDSENRTQQAFYAGLERKVQKGQLSMDFQKEIQQGLAALEVLADNTQPLTLLKFITDFKKKYDKEKIPLLQAVDPDIGIGYGSSPNFTGDTSLLRNVNFRNDPDKTISLKWSAVHRILLDKWNNLSQGNYNIQLNDIRSFKSKSY